MILKNIDQALSKGACLKSCAEVLEVPKRSIERWRAKGVSDERRGPNSPANKILKAEEEVILRVLKSVEFRDLPPTQIVPKLADKGLYIASESTFYRILKKHNLNAHRGPVRARTNKKPEQIKATAPNQLWSWDITYLKTEVKGRFYYLYLFVDIFSRYIVGFDVFEVESGECASELLKTICSKHKISKNQIHLHQDNGAPMKSANFLSTLQWLGVTPSFNRPRVSDDNAYSESLFKTLKYRPGQTSKRFESIEEAKEWVKTFVDWYNNIHLHSQIKFVTPRSRHYGDDKEVLLKRNQVYEKARLSNPSRWSQKKVRNWEVLNTVYLNCNRKKENKAIRPCPEGVRAGCEEVKSSQPGGAAA